MHTQFNRMNRLEITLWQSCKLTAVLAALACSCLAASAQQTAPPPDVGATNTPVRTAALAEAEAISQLATAAFKATGDRVKARTEWEHALQVDLDCHGPCYNLAILAEMEDRYADAVSWYERFLKLEPASKASVNARVHLTEARRVVEQLSTPAGREDYAVTRGVAEVRELRDDGRMDEALAASAKLSREWPKRFEPHLLAATIHLGREQIEPSQTELRAALELCPEDRKEDVKTLLAEIEARQRFQAAMQSGRAKLEHNDTNGAAVDFRAVWQSRTGDPEAGFALAGVLSQNGNLTEAYAILQTLARSPKREVAEQAVLNARQLRPLAEGNQTLARMKGGGAYLAAVEHWKSGDLAGADAGAGQAIQALQLEPAYSSFFALRAELRAAAGDAASAERDFLRASELNPASVQPQVGLAALASRQGDWIKAAGYFGLAAGSQPSSPESARLRLRQAIALARSGSPAEGLALLDDRLMASLSPSNAKMTRTMIYSWRARLRELAGMTDVQKELAQAQEAMPSPWLAWRLTQSDTAQKQKDAQPKSSARPIIDMSILNDK